MTTFAVLKSVLARRLHDPDAQTFTDDDLSDMVNEAIAEVSRIAPQPFIEDIAWIDGRTRYRLRGGNANQVANASFDEGDDTILLLTAPVSVPPANAPTLLQGWQLIATTPLHFPKSVNRVTGLRVARLVPSVAQADATLYQDIPVNANTSYSVEGYHWKEITGGLASRLEIETRDVNGDLVQSVWTHDTTASVPVLASTSYVTADDGSEVYIRIKLICVGTQPTVQQAFLFEDISVSESSQAVLVAPNAVNEIEVSRVEIWTTNQGVPSPSRLVPRPGSSRIQYSEVGWRLWGGVLELPFRYVNAFSSNDFIRVWGYAPYDALVDEEQVTDLTAELEWAVMVYCDLLGYRRLMADRNLFTQWQTRANNTDISPAGLMNMMNLAENSWQRKARQLAVLRT